ncbi:Hypothetical protein CINCED_3A011436 [Cinara cedri]|nr:Hypothetical protein CINCED_3A011436 [Cinara cedri]
MSGRRCSAVTPTVALILLLAVAARLPTCARASALRPVSAQPSGGAVVAVAGDGDDAATELTARQRRDAPAAVPTPTAAKTVVRKKRTIFKLKPLIVLPAKVALGAGSKLVAGAKLGAKAVGLGAKALGVGAVGLKAVKKVAKVTVKAATALGVKAVLLNFLFQKINQAIDFKTRLLSNLDQKNRLKNAQFLGPILPNSPKSSSGSIGNKEDDDFLAASPGDDQQILAQEQSKTSVVAPAVLPTENTEEVTFDVNKVTLQVPDRLFGPSFTAVNGISQTIGTVIQNAAGRLARLVEAVKAAIWRKAASVSSISNSSGSFAGNGQTAGGNRGSRDAAAAVQTDDGLDLDPLDEAASAAAAVSSKKRSPDAATDTAGAKGVDG